MDIYKCPKWCWALIPFAIKLHVFTFPPTLEEKTWNSSKKVPYKQFFRPKYGNKKCLFLLPLEIVSKYGNYNLDIFFVMNYGNKISRDHVYFCYHKF